MSQTIELNNGFITLSDTNFKCPRCQFEHGDKDYYKRLYNSKRGFIYKSCNGCKIKLGISVDYKGDVVVWLKDEEITTKNNIFLNNG